MHHKNLSLESIVYVNEEGIECTEQWKDVPSHEGFYQVSDLGRVKSMERKFKKSNGVFISYKEKILISSLQKTGYLKSNLYKNQNESQYLVHQLVAMAFLEHKLDGTNKTVVDHKNNIRTDNELKNLQLITNRENSSKDKKNGTSKYTGVMWHKKKQKWESRIRVNGRLLFLGLFLDELDAHNAYVEKLEEIKNR